MRTMRFAWGGILLSSLYAGPATAGDEAPMAPLPAVQPAGFEYDDYLSFAPKQPAAAELPPQALPPAPTVVSAPACAAGSDVACVDACDLGTDCGGGCFDGCCRGWELGGWLQQGITTSGRRQPDNWNGVVGFNDRDGEYMLNQLYFFLKRDVDTGGCGWDIGGRVDFLYGEDARYTQALGLETPWEQTGLYQLAIPQFYLDVGINDWTVRMGHFYTILGYETVTAPDNFFYSHTYSHMYGEPFTHLGMLVTRKINDQLKVSGGFHRGWDVAFEDRDDQSLGFLGGINWTSANERVNVAWGLSASEEFEGNEVLISTLVAKLQLTNRFEYVIQNDVGRIENDVDQAEWYSLVQYFLYRINPCWGAGVRVEWFRDDDGTRVAGLGVRNYVDPTLSRVNPHDGPYVGDFYEVAAGLNWKPYENLVLRPELRWDWFEGESFGTQRPYVGDRNGQFNAAVDMILTY